jgi:hypothetical protein
MKTPMRFIFVLLLGFVLLISPGCGKKQSINYSGFMGEYPKFKEGPKDGADFLYIREGVFFGAYDSIMMDHVVFYFHDESEYEGIHPELLKELADAFHEAMIDALRDGYPFVDKPGPGVLRVRFAITDVVASKPALNTISAILPVGLAVSAVKKGATGKHTAVGGASMEVELLDSQTNERIGAAIDAKYAEKYKIVKGMSKYGHAKDAFKFWAERFRKWLDEQHGRK